MTEIKEANLKKKMNDYIELRQTILYKLLLIESLSAIFSLTIA